MKNKDSKKIKSLILKVKALAEKGDLGERDSAQRKLKELMSKYQITKFEESKYKKRVFKLSDFQDCKLIMAHCIYDSNPKASIEGSLQKKELYVSLTDEQYIDTVEKFNHYYPIYIKQRESFLVAFILKNNLGVNPAYSENDTDSTEVENVVDMMRIISATPYAKFKSLN